MVHNPDPETLRALRTFLSKIDGRWAIDRAILFGSRARGTHRPDSDADLALVMSGGFDDFLRTRLDMADVAFDAMLETGILVSAMPIAADQWASPELHANPRLLAEIRRDGIDLSEGSIHDRGMDIKDAALEILETLYFYDRPLLFVGRIVDDGPNLFIAVDETDGGMRYLAIRASDEIVEDLKGNRIDVRDAFRRDGAVLLQVEDAGAVSQVVSYASADDIPDECLSSPGARLSPGV